MTGVGRQGRTVAEPWPVSVRPRRRLQSDLVQDSDFRLSIRTRRRPPALADDGEATRSANSGLCARTSKLLRSSHSSTITSTQIWRKSGPSSNDLAGLNQHRLRDLKPENPCGLEVNYKPEPHAVVDGNVRWFRSSQDLCYDAGSAAISLGYREPIRHEASFIRKHLLPVCRWQSILGSEADYATSIGERRCNGRNDHRL